MAKSGGIQKLRLIYLYQLLCEETDEQHALSRAQIFQILSERFDIVIDRKTFYDDLRFLELLGVDVQHGEGKGTYFLASREFEMPELHLLVDAIQSSRFITEKKSRELIDKLAHLCSRHQAQGLKSQVFLSTRNKTLNEAIYYNIDAIYRAITAGKQLSYRYYGWSLANGKLIKAYRREERYQVSPLSVAWNDEKYYLIAFDPVRDEVRHYRIDKMEQIAVEDLPALPQNDRFDSGSYVSKLFNMQGGVKKQVTLRFDKDLLGVAVDQFGSKAHLRPDDEEHFLLICDVVVSSGFYGFLFSLQDRVRLLAPAECVEEYKKHLHRTSELY